MGFRLYIGGMIPAYTPTRKQYIRDVALPTIGDALAKSKRRKKVVIPVRQATDSAVRLRLNPRGKITRVASPAVQAYKHDSPGRPNKKHDALAGINWLPKKYTLQNGVITDWHAKTFSELKLAAPVLASLAALMFLVLSWQLPDVPDYTRGGTKKISKTVQAAQATPAARPTATKPNPTNASSGNYTPSTSQASPILGQSASNAPTSSPPVSLPVTPIDVVVPVQPPVSGAGAVITPPPVSIDVPPISVDTGPLGVQTPEANLNL
jgi:hypothetical protein